MDPIVQQIILDLSRAEQQLADLQRRLDGISGTVDVGLNTQGDAFNDLRRGLDEASEAATGVARATSEITDQATLTTDQYRQVVAAMDAGVSPAQAIAQATGQAAVQAGDVDEAYRRLASSLGVSEEEARRLSTETAETVRSASRLDDDFRQVASDLGLSEREARELARQMQRVETETDQTADSTGRLEGSFRKLRNAIGALGVGLGVREVGQFFGDAVSAASTLEQSIGGVEAIFGEAAEEVLTFGENAASSVGLARNSFNELTAQLGAQLQSYGFSIDEAAGKSTELVGLGADLAATFGGPVSDAVSAIGSLLRGEINPIERYGVAVNQAAIQANALATGLTSSTGEMDIQTRALSALDLLYQQTGGAQGQFAREAGTVAGQQERLNAQWQDAQAALGEALVPAVQSFLDVAPDLLSIVEQLAPAFATLADNLAATGDEAAGGGFVPFLSDSIRVGQGFTDIVGGIVGAGGEMLAVLNDIRRLDFGAVLDSIARGGANLEGIIENLSFRGVEQGLVDLLRAGEDPALAFASALTVLDEQGNSTVDMISRLASTSGLGAQQLAAVISQLRLAGLIDTPEGMAATQQILEDLAATEVRGPNFARAGRGTREAAEDLAVYAVEANTANLANRELSDSAIDTAESFDDLTGADLPVVIRNLDDLAFAADSVGLSLVEFIAQAENADNIRLDLSGAERQLAGILDTLGEVQDALSGFTLEGFEDVELPELEFDSSGAVTNLDDVISALIDEAASDAQFEADLGTIVVDADAVDLAAFLEGLEPEVAAALAAAFAEDSQAARDAQAALDGTMTGLADDAALQLAETLAGATPAEIAALGVFAADNFVSPTIRSQLAETSEELAGLIAEFTTDSLSGTVISPELIIDLSLAELRNFPTGSIPIPAPSSIPTVEEPGGSPGGGNINVNTTINNPVTQDLSTDTARAEQAIAAVASTLPRVD